MAFPKRRLAAFICFVVFPAALVFASLRLLCSLQAPSSADPASTTKEDTDTPWLSFHRPLLPHHHQDDEFRLKPEVVMTASGHSSDQLKSQDVLHPPNPSVDVDEHPLKFSERTSKEATSDRPRTDHGGCVVPNFRPRDAITNMFSRKLPPPECEEEEEPWLTSSSDGALFLNASLLSRHQERADNCSYEEIRRLGDEDVAFAEPVLFRDGVRPPADFVRVRCDVASLITGKTRNYTAYHFLMREKPAPEKTLQQRMRERKRRARDSGSSPKTGEETAPDWINVIMLGVDSTSRHNMIRLMPKTRHFLLKELGAVEMTNYNKVADNTFPNMFALMSGLTLEEAEWMKTVEKTRAQERKESVAWENLGQRFLWQDFAEAGYRTLYNEDLHRINIFFLENIYFRQEPTYFYGRPLEIAKEEYSGLFTQGGRCFGGKSSDRLMLSYPLEYVRLFRNKPHFSFNFMVRTTHNALNGPGQVDAEVSRFLNQLQTEELMNNTLLLLFSDHGLRYGPFRMTAAGKFEDSRPFMFLAFPRRFSQQWPQLLGRVQSNAARFTTPLDVHSTLLDLLFLNHRDPPQHRRKTGRGISLFKTIPANRSCLDAGVPAHFCVCLTERPLSATSAAATAAGSVLIDALNAALSNVRHKCHTLTLSQIISFVQLQGQEDYLQHYCGRGSQSESLDHTYEGKRGFYRLTLVAAPGGGLFEATLVKCGQESPFRFVGEYAHINRLNRYGETAACVGTSHFLEKICFCKTGGGQGSA